MIKYENDCFDCPKEIGCLGFGCPLYRVPHYYCDKCKDETDNLYQLYEMHLCKDCLLKTVPIIKL